MLLVDVVPPARLVELSRNSPLCYGQLRKREKKQLGGNANHHAPPLRREWLGRGAPATLSERGKSKKQTHKHAIKTIQQSKTQSTQSKQSKQYKHNRNNLNTHKHTTKKQYKHPSNPLNNPNNQTNTDNSNSPEQFQKSI